MGIRNSLGRLRRTLDSGSMSVELVVLTPVMLGFVLFLVACGRVGLAQISVQDAANAAARDASLSRTDGDAQTNAQAAANNSMTDNNVNCRTLNVVVDTSGLDTPIGTTGDVSTTVTCVVNLSDIALPGLPGQKTITTTATSPVDPYRQR